MVATGATAATDLLTSMGTGAAGMFETTMVAILVSAICALIREYGGFVWLLNAIKNTFKNRKGGQLGMGILVGCMDIATANNTVAIVMANPSRQIWRNLQYLAPQDRIYPRYVLVRFPGHHPLWRTNAHRHCNDRKRRLCNNGIPDYSVLVLPLHAAHQLVGLYLPDSRPPRIRWRRCGSHRSVKRL